MQVSAHVKATSVAEKTPRPSVYLGKARHRTQASFVGIESEGNLLRYTNG